MEILNNLVVSFNDFLWGYILIILLIGAGLLFSFKTKFVQFRYIKEMFRLLGDGIGKSNKEKGGVSSFQAFCISTASRVGTGNIAGVAIAVAVGGPGAVFWMWLIALIGSASSFVESTLAQIYKTKDKDSFRGGPAYYMEKGLGKRWLGIIFSILITICFGFVFNAVQANTVSVAFNSAFGLSRGAIGIILAIVTALVIFGGIHRVAKVSEIIVPILAVLYILIAIIVLILNITEIPSVFKLIFESAFGIKQLTAGGLGAAVMQGIKRGLFSNEAGMGSAPNAAATADVTHPVKQGLIQTLGVFTDTLLICSCTAFIILLSGQYADSSLTGIELTQKALVSQIGPFGAYFIAICILLFAFSSIVGNFYYGQTNIEFIHTNKVLLNIYRILVIAMVLFGSIAKVDLVWNLADLFMGLMAILNIITILFLGKYSFLALKDYTAQKKAGIKEPVFKASSIPGLENVEEWQ
ncbi:alanine:cation symporter family protein [Clostridium perfringens]|uniref:Alanine:cation symporter family protein n=2 Tax=Clostridium TaxID=1485 RepID=A0A9X3XK38_9CLOT|nr:MULTISPECIES: alanine/glycine:cation symporter family protein [Clostridium]EDT16264.1 sodium:alanine symporter family protein [Clostridium perfringens E str. JGS1987]EHK2387683.1 alanine:cation symporter family protein [Clostridium perfringens]EJT6558584.1 alanine:cation symporter family protein [Clostridium perfringens]ELC8436113.1 alanine:cation symporter family protein [Clostridium perfringens]ELC8458167.1 alanine:cation symporter family protein [Clostridium perfringens]